MNASNGVAPAVESILRAARDREAPEKRLAIEARSFPEAVAAAEREGRVPVIAEVKPTSPTTEGVREDSPIELAREMVAGGATAISVLTEPEHFGGSAETLEEVRKAVDVPVLRKDFVLRESQMDIVEADLILLIARFVEDLGGLVSAAKNRGFQPLVEVHTREELAEAVEAGAEIVGINNRDLARLEVELGSFERVGAEAPEDVLLVAESGISSVEDVQRMREAGADALLIGTAIMDGDVRENTKEFTNV